MSHLNSILIEGAASEARKPRSEKICIFKLCSERFLDRRGNKRVTFFNVVVENKALIEACLEKIGMKPREVRIIGRLDKDSSRENTVIVAEHVEFRK